MLLGVVSASAQDKPADQSPKKKNTVVFKIPDGFMPARMTDRDGMTMLNPNAPARIFMTYTPDNVKYVMIRSSTE